MYKMPWGSRHHSPGPLSDTRAGLHRHRCAFASAQVGKVTISRRNSDTFSKPSDIVPELVDNTGVLADRYKVFTCKRSSRSPNVYYQCCSTVHDSPGLCKSRRRQRSGKQQQLQKQQRSSSYSSNDDNISGEKSLETTCNSPLRLPNLVRIAREWIPHGHRQGEASRCVASSQPDRRALRQEAKVLHQ